MTRSARKRSTREAQRIAATVSQPAAVRFYPWSAESVAKQWSLFGDGHFTGTFHIFKGGREIKGNFSSAVAGVYDYRFPKLRGALRWVPDRFEVTDASSDFSGGRATFVYSMAPLGKPTPALA